MRIAQISPLWERVPPPAYGGTEAVVHALTEGLMARGHEVVLYASGDSITSAELRPSYARSLRTAEGVRDTAPYEWQHIADALEEADEFDIIHNHAGELPMAMSRLVNTPMLTTMHCLITPDTRFVWQRYVGYYNTISHTQRCLIPSGMAGGKYTGFVYNGIDVKSFPFREHKEEHLLFLSRIAPEKGAHLAIKVARKTGIPLLMAGKVDRVDREYFRTSIEPHIDGELVRYVGEVSREQTKSLFSAARALLLPLLWEEPFGLVMAEAMATGTPVIAFRRGAAPELVLDGETGFLVESGDVEAMAKVIRRLDQIDPRRCRQHVAEKFDVSRMVEGYVSTYERILKSARRPLRMAGGVPAPARQIAKEAARNTLPGEAA